MFMVCPSCGLYSEEKIIDPAGPYAICPFCAYAYQFIRQPLFSITGASGTGKSTVGLELVKALPECVVLESDILWRPEFANAQDDYVSYRNTWLRLANNIGQNGRPVVLMGSTLPGQFEKCVQSRYFSRIYYLALVCDDEVLAERLRARPDWRKSGTDETVKNMVAFNNWFKQKAPSCGLPVTLFDTTDRTVDETRAFSLNWVRQILAEINLQP